MEVIHWSNSRNDIKTILKIRFGFVQIGVIQQYQTLALIISKAFGGKKKKGKPPRSFDEATAQLSGVFGGNTATLPSYGDFAKVAKAKVEGG